MASYSGLVCLKDFEKHALSSLPRNANDYFKSGANDEETLQENAMAFRRLRFRPRFLRDVSKIDLATTILGQPISFPVAVAPTAMQKLAHPDGELATARAAAKARTIMILSTIATSSIEEVAESAPGGIHWFQLYVYKDRAITKQLVQRAERAGFAALVLTVDTPFLGNRLADTRNRFQLPPHLRLPNFSFDDKKSSRMSVSKGSSAISEYAASLFDPSLSWHDIDWLKSITKLPIVIKGILTAEDAKLAVDHGASAILVSNHGARQLDYVPATIEALPEVARAVKGLCEVYLDGGVRNGTDVLKALALGAKAVFVGRPIVWGLAHSGEEGARRILEILRTETSAAMGLSGCSRVSDVTLDLVVPHSHYTSSKL